MIDSLSEWAAEPNVPNVLFIIALLTSPKTWSRWVKRAVEEKFFKEEEEEE